MPKVEGFRLSKKRATEIDISTSPKYTKLGLFSVFEISVHLKNTLSPFTSTPAPLARFPYPGPRASGVLALVPSDLGDQVVAAPSNAEFGKPLRENIQIAIRPFSWFVRRHARHEFQDLQRYLLHFFRNLSKNSSASSSNSLR